MAASDVYATAYTQEVCDVAFTSVFTRSDLSSYATSLRVILRANEHLRETVVHCRRAERRHHRDVAFGVSRVSARLAEEEWRPPSSRASVALSNRNAHPNKEDADGEILRAGCTRHELHCGGGEWARQEAWLARHRDERRGADRIPEVAGRDDSRLHGRRHAAPERSRRACSSRWDALESCGISCEHTR